MNSSIYHNVPIMRQPQSWACWYTSLQMVVAYYRKHHKGNDLVDPSENPETQSIYTANQGIGAGGANERERIARQLGFTAGYLSFTNEGMWDQLRYGPVIYAGRWPGLTSGHWVVIVGISQTTLAINNPAAGLQNWDYNFFMGKYLLQTQERPLVYVPKNTRDSTTFPALLSAALT
jgi:ABC-type bacteriocin/lantibiotic exporter with double-glycine peptidase domain